MTATLGKSALVKEGPATSYQSITDSKTVTRHHEVATMTHDVFSFRWHNTCVGEVSNQFLIL